MEISKYDSVIDSCDIIERIEELEAELEELFEADNVDDFEGAEELRLLVALAAEGKDAAEDWNFGVTLINDSHFEAYAEEYAEEIGAIDPSAASWPLMHIDWAAAADDLQQDYTSIEFDGETYWVR